MSKSVARFGWIAVAVYVLLMAATSVAMFAARAHAVRSFGTAEAQEDWEQWREETRRQEGADSPVARRIPKAAEPPTLVLLRDYFATCLVGALVLTSLLYWAFAFLVRGALCGPSFQINKA